MRHVKKEKLWLESDMPKILPLLASPQAYHGFKQMWKGWQGEEKDEEEEKPGILKCHLH